MTWRLLLTSICILVAFGTCDSTSGPSGHPGECFDDETRIEGCRCVANETLDSEAPMKLCCCIGKSVLRIPHNFTKDVEAIILQDVGMVGIGGEDFKLYPLLTSVDIRDAARLASINASAFSHLPKLKKLHILNCPKLKVINGVLLENNPDLRRLYIVRTGLEKIPTFRTKHRLKLSEIIMSNNALESVESSSLGNLSFRSLDLSHNRIRYVGANAFAHSIIDQLMLSDNPLMNLDENAFKSLQIKELYLSRTQLTKLPEEGLFGLTILEINNTQTLKKMPSPMAFGHLQRAHLTYAHHCCFFKHVDLSPKSPLHMKFPKNLEELKKNHCKKDYSATTQTFTVTHNPRRRRRFIGWGNYVTPSKATVTNLPGWTHRPSPAARKESFGETNGIRDDFDRDYSPDFDPDEEEDEHAEMDYRDIPSDPVWVKKPFNVTKKIIVTQKVCEGGDYEELIDYFRNIECTPESNPLNPCEGVMGYKPLSVLVWPVWLSAIIGNVLVLLVLCMTHHPRMRVHYFLMMNLAFADLCVGVYLAMLAVEDVMTAGQYYNFAVDWQTGFWCQLAGFISVFASELSIVTMFLISFDNWYNTKYIFYGYRLEMKAAVPAMALGWLFSLVMAALPLGGVSSYTLTSTCLPLKVDTTPDRVYIIFGLAFNVVAFIAITAGYISIYYMVGGSGSPGTRSEDAKIAKKMFILIFTDFLCWAPTIFFGLTGAAQLPLISISVAKIFLVIFYPINSMANPFLYVFFTKMFRKDMSRVARKHLWMQKLKPANIRSSFTSNHLHRYYSSNPPWGCQGTVTGTGTGASNGTDTTNISRTSSPRGSSASIPLKRGSAHSLKTSYECRHHGQYLEVPLEMQGTGHRRQGSNGMGRNSDPESGRPGEREGLIPLLRRKSLTLQLRPRFQPQMSDISENSHSQSHSSHSNDELDEIKKSLPWGRSPDKPIPHPSTNHPPPYTAHLLRPVQEEKKSTTSLQEGESSDWGRRSSGGSWKTPSSYAGSHISESKFCGSEESGLMNEGTLHWTLGKLRRESGQSAESGYVTSMAGTPDTTIKKFDLPMIGGPILQKPTVEIVATGDETPEQDSSWV